MTYYPKAILFFSSFNLQRFWHNSEVSICKMTASYKMMHVQNDCLSLSYIHCRAPSASRADLSVWSRFQDVFCFVFLFCIQQSLLICILPRDMGCRIIAGLNHYKTVAFYWSTPITEQWRGQPGKRNNKSYNLRTQKTIILRPICLLQLTHLHNLHKMSKHLTLSLEMNRQILRKANTLRVWIIVNLTFSGRIFIFVSVQFLQ